MTSSENERLNKGKKEEIEGLFNGSTSTRKDGRTGEMIFRLIPKRTKG